MKKLGIMGLIASVYSSALKSTVLKASAETGSDQPGIISHKVQEIINKIKNNIVDIKEIRPARSEVMNASMTKVMRNNNVKENTIENILSIEIILKNDMKIRSYAIITPPVHNGELLSSKVFIRRDVFTNSLKKIREIIEVYNIYIDKIDRKIRIKPIELYINGVKTIKPLDDSCEGCTCVISCEGYYEVSKCNDYNTLCLINCGLNTASCTVTCALCASGNISACPYCIVCALSTVICPALCCTDWGVECASCDDGFIPPK